MPRYPEEDDYDDRGESRSRDRHYSRPDVPYGRDRQVRDRNEAMHSGGFSAREDDVPVDKDGKSPILGGLLKIDPTLAKVINPIVRDITPDIVENSSHYIDKYAAPALRGAFGDAKGNLAAGLLGQGVKLGLIYEGELGGIASNAIKLKTNFKTLDQQLASVLVAGHDRSGIRGIAKAAKRNEVIHDARKDVIDQWKEGLKRDSIGLTSSAMVHLRTHLRGKLETTESDNEIKKLEHQLGILRVAILGTAPLATEIQQRIEQGRSKAEHMPTVLEMVLHLTEAMNEEPGRDTLETINGRTVSVKDYVKAIFNEHQRIRKQAEIGHHLDKPFDLACGEIAEAIMEGRMSPKALVVLVGERKIVKPGGKALASPEQIEKALTEQCTRLPATPPVDVEQYVKEAPITLDDMKAIFASLKGPDRDLFSTEHPMEVMAKLGQTEEQHQLAVERVGTRIGGLVKRQVGKLDRLSDDELGKTMSPESITLLRETAEEAREKDGLREIRQKLSAGPEVGGIKFIVANDPNLWKKGAAAVKEAHHAPANDDHAALPDSVVAGDGRAHHGMQGEHAALDRSL